MKNQKIRIIKTILVITSNSNSKNHRIDNNVDLKVMRWLKFSIHSNLFLLKRSVSSNYAWKCFRYNCFSKILGLYLTMIDQCMRVNNFCPVAVLWNSVFIFRKAFLGAILKSSIIQSGYTSLTYLNVIKFIVYW